MIKAKEAKIVKGLMACDVSSFLFSTHNQELFDIWKPGEPHGEGGGADTESNEEEVAEGERFLRKLSLGRL